MRIPYFVAAAFVVAAAVPGGAQAQWSPAAIDGPTVSLDQPAGPAVAHAPLEIVAERLPSAAPGTVRGQVIDAATNAPVAQVQVTIMGTAFGALTDDAGNYLIVGVPPGLYSLEARRLGYVPSYQENISVPDGGTVTVNFEMGVVAFSLDAMVVTGVTEEVSARRIPFTVAKVGPEKLEVPSANALNSIQGKIAGATVVAPAQPGSGTNIVLRSPTSIYKSNSPLIVVDGVVLASTFTRSSTDLDALDIETIEVVKGAAASSLYGSRASNGVIQIKTRRGTALAEGQTRVTLRTEWGTSQLARDVGLASHHQYLVNAQGQYVDTDGNVVDREFRVERPLDERYLDVPYLDPVYDHVQQFYNPGSYSSNSISIGRNSANTNFYASYAYRREAGVVLEHDGYKQHDLRLNLDHRLGANLQFSASAYHMRSVRAETPQDMFFNLVQQAPDADLLQPDPDGTPYIWQPDPLGVTPNPLYALSVQTDDGKRARTLLSSDLRWTPIGWLSVDGNLSYDRSDRLGYLYFPRGKKTEIQLYQDGFIENFNGVTTALNGSASVNARGRVGDLSIRGTARALFEREDYNAFTAQVAGLTVADVPDLDAGTTPLVTGASESIRSEGYFLIGSVDYRGKYIFDGLVRRDGSSLFGAEQRWHTYFRASGAWRMAEESWWPLRDQINEFKLRYSIGTAGGRPSFSDRFETYAFSSSGGIVKSTLGNRYLKPEHATEQELGLDAIIGNRVEVQLVYAKVKTTDQLVLVPLSAAFGFTAQWQNAGTVEGNTWEASVQATLLRNRDMQWSLGVVADRSRHTVTQFDRACFRTGPDNAFYLCEGETLGTMYGYDFLSSADQLPEGVPADEFQLNDEGYLVWVGTGGNWQQPQWGTASLPLGTDQRTYQWGIPNLQYDSTGNPAVLKIGDANADMHLGLSTTFRWKGLSVFGLLDMQFGGDVYNRTKQRMYQYFRSGDADQAGRPEELKKTTSYYTALYGANLINSRFAEPGGFIKLREVSVRWQLPSSVLAPLGGVGLDNLTLFAIGRNLFTSTDYSGYDPEVGTPLQRFDDYSYPHFRTLSAGAEIAF